MPVCYHRSMRVVVLGASGESGLEVVREGLARGIQITAGVRDTTKTEHIDHENFTSVKVDVFSEESLASVFAGHDAVVSALGFPKNPAGVNGFSKTIPLIVSAMRTAQVKRLVLISAWFTEESSRTHPFYQTIWQHVPGLVNVLDDTNKMENWLQEEAPDIWWASVKPGSLCWGEGTGRDLKYRIGQEVVEESFFIRRADLARGLLDVLVSGARGRVSVGEVCSKDEEKTELKSLQSIMQTMQEVTMGSEAQDMTAFFHAWEKLIDQK